MTSVDRFPVGRQIVIDVDEHGTGNMARSVSGSGVSTVEIPANVGDDHVDRRFGEQAVDVVDRQEGWTRHAGVRRG